MDAKPPSELDEVVMGAAQARIPAVARTGEAITGQRARNQTANPDEVVAVGGRHFQACAWPVRSGHPSFA